MISHQMVSIIEPHGRGVPEVACTCTIIISKFCCLCLLDYIYMYMYFFLLFIVYLQISLIFQI